MDRVLLEKLTGSQLVKNFSLFSRARTFIFAFTSARHLSVSGARSIQSIPPIPHLEDPSLYYPPIYAHVLPSGVFLSGFPTKTLYIPYFPPCVLHTLLVLFFTI